MLRRTTERSGRSGRSGRLEREALLQASFLSAQPLRDTRLQRRGARLVNGFPALRRLGYFGRFGNFEGFRSLGGFGGLHVLQSERVAQLVVLATRGYLPEGGWVSPSGMSVTLPRVASSGLSAASEPVSGAAALAIVANVCRLCATGLPK